MNRRMVLGKTLGGAVFLLCGVFVLLFWQGVGMSSDTQPNAAHAAVGGARSGGAAPDFELEDLSGSVVRLSKFKGERPVLLYFWATWCPYCIAVKPQIAKIRENFAQDEMEILGINVGEGDSLERLKRFQEGHPVTWPILYDNGAKVSRSYRVQGIPLFVLVDKEGNMVYRGNNPPLDPKEYLH